MSALISSITHLRNPSIGQQLADSLVRNTISGNRGGSSGGGSSDILNSFRYGGLFNEKNGHDANKPKVTVSGAGPGGMFSQFTFTKLL